MSSEKEQLKGFESLVIKLKNEYAEKNGAVTCEFSTQKRQVLHLNLMSLSEINLGGGERRTTTKWWL